MSDEKIPPHKISHDELIRLVEKGLAKNGQDSVAQIDRDRPQETDSVVVGDQLDKYTLLRLIGRGGMGAVFVANHQSLHKHFAVKVLSNERLSLQLVRRFKDEMRTAARLVHENVVRTTDAGCDDGIHYLAMDLVNGSNAREVVAQKGALQINNACEIVRQVCLGLCYAYERPERLIHRDIKPSNVLIDANGRVLIADFGLARAVFSDNENPRNTSSGQILGTPNYISPEQGMGQRDLDCRTDIYSLGCTLFYLINGVPIFGEGKNQTPMQRVLAHLTYTIPPLSDSREIPKKLEALYLRMVAKDRDFRPENYHEIIEELKPFCVGSSLSAVVSDIKPPIVVSPSATTQSGNQEGTNGATVQAATEAREGETRNSWSLSGQTGLWSVLLLSVAFVFGVIYFNGNPGANPTPLDLNIKSGDSKNVKAVVDGEPKNPAEESPVGRNITTANPAGEIFAWDCEKLTTSIGDALILHKHSFIDTSIASSGNASLRIDVQGGRPDVYGIEMPDRLESDLGSMCDGGTLFHRVRLKIDKDFDFGHSWSVKFLSIKWRPNRAPGALNAVFTERGLCFDYGTEEVAFADFDLATMIGTGWHEYILQVQKQTSPSKPNGTLRLYVDGKQIWKKERLQFTERRGNVTQNGGCFSRPYVRIPRGKGGTIWIDDIATSSEWNSSIFSPPKSPSPGTWNEHCKNIFTWDCEGLTTSEGEALILHNHSFIDLATAHSGNASMRMDIQEASTAEYGIELLEDTDTGRSCDGQRLFHRAWVKVHEDFDPGIRPNSLTSLRFHWKPFQHAVPVRTEFADGKFRVLHGAETNQSEFDILKTAGSGWHEYILEIQKPTSLSAQDSAVRLYVDGNLVCDHQRLQLFHKDGKVTQNGGWMSRLYAHIPKGKGGHIWVDDIATSRQWNSLAWPPLNPDSAATSQALSNR